MTDLPRQFQILFVTFPPPAGDLSAQLEAYARAIAGHDLRDIDAAVDRFLRGEVVGHNQSFAPSASLVGGAVRQCMMDRLDAERRVRKPALPPPDIVKSPEARERVRMMAEAHVAELASKLRTPDAQRAAETKRWQDRMDARFVPPQDDAAMARRLGLARDDEQDVA